MKAKFSAVPTREVTLTHGEQTLVLRLTPPPIGYGETLAALLPKPRECINLKWVDHSDPAKMAEWTTRRVMLLLAKALGEQVEAKEPGVGAGPAAWAAYADSVRTEFEDAHFVEGDLQILTEALASLQRGMGDLPKA